MTCNVVALLIVFVFILVEIIYKRLDTVFDFFGHAIDCTLLSLGPRANSILLARLFQRLQGTGLLSLRPLRDAGALLLCA